MQFVGEGAHGCIVEESVVDHEAKTFTTYTRNINFTKMMTVVEKNTFYVSSENENWYFAGFILFYHHFWFLVGHVV